MYKQHNFNISKFILFTKLKLFSTLYKIQPKFNNGKTFIWQFPNQGFLFDKWYINDKMIIMIKLHTKKKTPIKMCIFELILVFFSTKCISNLLIRIQRSYFLKNMNAIYKILLKMLVSIFCKKTKPNIHFKIVFDYRGITQIWFVHVYP